MLSLLGLKSLCQVHGLLNSSLVCSRNRVNGVGKDVIVIRADFSHGHDGFIHLSFDDIIIGQLFSENSNLSFETTHFVFIIGFCLIELAFEKVEFFSEHVILVFVDIKVSKCLLVDTVDSLKFF